MTELQDWTTKQIQAAKDYEEAGETDAAENLRRRTSEVGQAYGKSDIAAKLVVAVEQREGELTANDKALLDQVKEDTAAKTRAEKWLGASVDDIVE